MNDINWPKQYLLDTTDYYVSNYITVADLNVEEIWPRDSNESQAIH